MSAAHASPGSMVYASALADAVEAEGGKALLQDVGSVLAAFAGAWEQDAVLRRFFVAAEVKSGPKQAAMDKLVDGRFPKLLANFLRLLLRRNRLTLLPEIHASYRELLDERLGRVPVTVTTAVPVPESDFQTWKAAIRDAVDGEAVVAHVVKPEILAGAVIRIGDRVLDGSARRRLSELHTRIIERGMQRNALQS